MSENREPIEPFSPPPPPALDGHLQMLIKMAVEEDMVGPGHRGPSDKTVEVAIPESVRATGTIVARKGGRLAGGFLLAPILALYKDAPALTILAADGARLAAGEAVARLHGSARAILSAERTLLNFLGHLSGVATLTAQYVDAIAGVRSTVRGTAPVIVDTRKTTPGFRVLDKYAVRCGGGGYHRMGLYDGVMLKDNHLAALREKLGAGMTLGELTTRIRGELDPTITLWLEVDDLGQLREELAAGKRGAADIVLLDNFSPAEMREAVAMRNAMGGRPLLEASGGITLENLREVAATGIDRIAIGALTHSAKVLDLSMDVE